MVLPPFILVVFILVHLYPQRGYETSVTFFRKYLYHIE